MRATGSAWLSHIEASARQGGGVPEGDGRADRETTDGGFLVTLSRVAGQVLDQLSISAWLPSLMLVGSVAVLVQLRALPQPSLADAITELTKAPLGIVIVLLIALVLATTITQSFEYQVIRTLEGYWGVRAVSSPFVRGGLWLNERRLRKLSTKKQDLTRRACRKAHRKLLSDAAFDAETVLILDKWSHGLSLDGHSDREVDRALLSAWQVHAPLHLVRRIEAINEIEEFLPPPRRIMPTRLGNTLRTGEDLLGARESVLLRTYVIDRWERMPVDLRAQFDQFRSRMNMYCMLVFVALVLALFSAVFLGLAHLARFATGFSIAYAVLALASYRAAVFTARALGDILSSIQRAVPAT